jgi:hypothetical protein
VMSPSPVTAEQPNIVQCLPPMSSPVGEGLEGKTVGVGEIHRIVRFLKCGLYEYKLVGKFDRNIVHAINVLQTGCRQSRVDSNNLQIIRS